MSTHPFPLAAPHRDQAPATTASVDLDDERALAAWLEFTRQRNKNTYRSYLAEVMRFRLFLNSRHRGRPGCDERFLLRDADEIDAASYEAQLLGRDRAGVGLAPLVIEDELLRQYGRTDQPFAKIQNGALTQARSRKASSVNLAISILHSLYEHWLRPDPRTRMSYVGANPFMRVKKSKARVARQTDRHFPIEALQAILQTLDTAIVVQQNAPNIGRSAQTSIQTLERQRWATALLFGLWARRAEIVRLKMADFRLGPTKDQWSVHLTTKGDGENTVPVASWVIASLMRYRTSLGMSALPDEQDARNHTPVLLRQRRRDDWAGKPISPALLYRDVCAACALAADAVAGGRVDGDMDETQRATLRATLARITPHWFRHSAATIAVNSGAMSLDSASKMLGHSSPVITARMYLHQSDQLLRSGVEEIGGGVFVAAKPADS